MLFSFLAIRISSAVILDKSAVVILERASYKEKINRLINDGISRVGTISQSSSETSFKLFRFTVGLSHSKKIVFCTSQCIYSFCKHQKTKMADIWAKQPQSQKSKFQKPNKSYTIGSRILCLSLFTKRLYLKK